MYGIYTYVASYMHSPCMMLHAICVAKNESSANVRIRGHIIITWVEGHSSIQAAAGMSATSPALRSPRLRLRLSHTFQQGVPKTRFAERPGMALGQRRWRLQPAADSAVWCTGRSVEQLKYSTTAAGQLTGTPTLATRCDTTIRVSTCT